MTKFGAILKLKNDKNLPLIIRGSADLKPISYLEKKGSAQCKSSIIFAGLRTDGTTIIKAKIWLIFADGFYDWKWLDKQVKKMQKYLIELPNSELFSFAGLYDQLIDKHTG